MPDSPRMLVCDDADKASQSCAALIADKLREAVAMRGRASIALSGGHTPWPMIRALAAQELPWDTVHIFQTDERVVALDDPDRNVMRLKHELSSSRKIALETLNAMPVDEPDLAAARRHYEMDLRQIAGQPPVLDVVHLGLGSDGHTASLVPRDPVLDVAHADVSVTGCYQGHRRMTLTYPVLNRAEIIVWLVTGNGKADVLRRLYEGDRGIPAGRARSDRAVIVADKPAARLVNTHMSNSDAR